MKRYYQIYWSLEVRNSEQANSAGSSMEMNPGMNPVGFVRVLYISVYECVCSVFGGVLSVLRHRNFG